MKLTLPKQTRWAVVLILLVVALIPASLAFAADDATTEAQTGITATTYANLNMRVGPDISNTAIRQIPRGTTVPAIARNAERTWIVVEWDGRRGWVFLGWVELNGGTLTDLPVISSLDEVDGDRVDDTPEPEPTSDPVPVASDVTATATANLRIRDGAGTSFEQVGIIPGGQSASVLAFHPDITWALINYNGTQGWAHRNWLNFSGDTASLPRITDASQLGGSTTTPTPEGPTPTPAPPDVESTPPPFNGLDSRYTGQFTNISPHLRAIFDRGQAMGNYANRFSRMGDSESDNPAYLYQFDQGEYLLGNYGYLQESIDYFSGSFGRLGEGARGGLISTALVDPFWADPNVCNAGENRIECEIRIYQPAFALIMTRTTPPVGLVQFEADLRYIAQLAIDNGVIMVFQTIPWVPLHPGYGEEENDVIRLVANDYNLPLWDVYATTITMPNQGVDDATAHLTVSPQPANFQDEDNLTTYGTVRRNLEALEVLHALKNVVIGE